MIVSIHVFPELVTVAPPSRLLAATARPCDPLFFSQEDEPRVTLNEFLLSPQLPTLLPLPFGVSLVYNGAKFATKKESKKRRKKISNHGSTSNKDTVHQ